MILYGLDTLQLTQEKEKNLSGSVFYWVIKRFLECTSTEPLNAQMLVNVT